jgi:hypothetical protein
MLHGRASASSVVGSKSRCETFYFDVKTWMCPLGKHGICLRQWREIVESRCCLVLHSYSEVHMRNCGFLNRPHSYMDCMVCLDALT